MATAAVKPPLPGGQSSFATCYAELCKQQRLRPLPVVSATLPHSLDFTTDRVKTDDWGPILNSLSLDRTLRSIGVRSRYQCRKPLEEVNSENNKARRAATGRSPMVLTRFVLEWLTHSVAQCVRNSPALTRLELEGIPLPPDCLAVLCVGLSATETLRHLSLQRCRLGDGGCELICRTVADARSIRSLDLSRCELGPRSGAPLAAALSRQKLSLYHDTWKQSLRYREPNLEAMPGLRRLTLNGNPRLGDSAVGDVVEAVRDSLWLKALDLQNCGLTDASGRELLRLLEHNVTLAIVDVRCNAALNDELAREVADKLEANNPGGGARAEYRWLAVPRKDGDDGRAVSAGFARRERRGATRRGRTAEGAIRPGSALEVSSKKGARGAAPPPPPPPRNKPRTTTATAAGVETKGSDDAPRSERKDSADADGAKPSLRLDLRTRMDSVVDATREDEGEEKSPRARTEREDEGDVKIAEDEDEAAAKVEEVLRRLAEARAEHDRLLEATKRNDLLLAEERARREIAEAKLAAARNELAELENALAEVKRETRGLPPPPPPPPPPVSRRSLDEIWSSFDGLLETLDGVARNHGGSRRSYSEEEEEDVRRRLALLTRKTKSENLDRVYGSRETLEPDSPVRGDARGKFARSEGDVRTTLLPPISPIRLERNIGDSPDVASPSRDVVLDGRRCTAKSTTLASSPGERARAIFAQIVNGAPVLEFGAFVG